MANTEFTFHVQGDGAFPVDMLRHDYAYPATETDSVRVTEDGPRIITLRSRSIHEPSYDRWRSFGWRAMLRLSKETT